MVFKGSFEDILFVLAGLAWVGYSAYRANRKNGRKSKDVATKESADSNSFLDELLSQFTDNNSSPKAINDNKEQVDATLNTVVESRNNPVEPFSYDDVYEEEKTPGNQQTLLGVKNELVEKKNRSAYQLNNKSSKRESFDLKRAFIYSEILRQKYI